MLAMLILSATLTSFLIVLMAWLVNYLIAWRHLRRFPAPPVWPIIGNALELKSTTDILNRFEYLFKKYNTQILRFNFGPRNTLCIKDYKLLEYILSSTKIIDKGPTYKFLESWLGTGLLTSTGEKWRKRRKMITPSFHFKILEQFAHIFEKESNILVEKLRSQVGKAKTDIYPYITVYALDVICETAMGTNVNAQQEEHSDYVYCVKNMCQLMQNRIFNPFFHYDFLYKFSSDYKTQEQLLKTLHDYTDSVIRKRRKELQNANVKREENEICSKKHIAFLDMLLQSTIDGKPLSDADIREEVDTFMFEGHDTTASALSFTLFSLANNPTVQEKAYEEIKIIFKNDRNRAATHKDLQDMKYLELVIKESLRLYPSVPLYIRRTKEKMQYGDLTLPKNLTLTIFAYGMQRNPQHFPNPDVFDPERFSMENSQGKLPFAYIPFSAGPRNCIGQKYAMLQMKSTISKILRHYELKPVVPAHKLLLSAETVLKSANGVPIRILERSNE